MKPVLYFLAFACIFLVTSCCNDKDQIKSTALNYLNAMYNYDFTKARELSDSKTESFIRFSEQLYVSFGQDSSIMQKATFNILNVELLTDTTARVYYTIEFDDNSQKEEDILDMIKQKNKWYAHQTKESGFPNFEEEADSDTNFTVLSDTLVN